MYSPNDADVVAGASWSSDHPNITVTVVLGAAGHFGVRVYESRGGESLRHHMRVLYVCVSQITIQDPVHLATSIMLLPAFDVFREQLTPLFHGHALWMPDPANLYERVSIGDVGFVKNGYFVRMFNVLLDWSNPTNYLLYDAESNPESQPENYVRLDLGPFVNIKQSRFSKGDYYSRSVNAMQDIDTMAISPDKYVISPYQTAASDTLSPRLDCTVYSCSRRHGALLTLPFDGLREDIIRTKVFEDFIRDHVDSWFAFARRFRLDVERMEDLILVTGCTLVTSCGVAAFVDSALDSEISLRTQVRHGGGATFDWRVNRPTVNYRNSYHDAVRSLCPHRHFVTNVSNSSLKG